MPGAVKKIRKRIKKDYQLVRDLHDTGICDAMHLAGLIADDLQTVRQRGAIGKKRRTAKC